MQAEKAKTQEPEVTAPEVTAPEVTAPEVTAPEEVRKVEVSKEEVDRILRHHVWGAVGVGLVPVPLVDLVALTGVQLNMLRKFAKVYNIPFVKDAAKNVVSSLVGSAVPVVVAPGLAASIAKVIPVFGQTVGVVTMPIIAGAATYALGKVFIQHFASGGTFLTFDPDKVKDYYTEMFKEGEKVAADMKKDRETK